ncbi:hypothetical protein EVAR_86074_1 [Eumeta japonica]|uniref:Uncharacterized protein n=1 Tax=Eumeta variegata TaxID=151549 RepID=A0A4C1UK88_EUMVA|nr:hypothetical protein EVAR_86074_1 [Eumeta japonica]
MKADDKEDETRSDQLRAASGPDVNSSDKQYSEFRRAPSTAPHPRTPASLPSKSYSYRSGDFFFARMSEYAFLVPEICPHARLYEAGPVESQFNARTTCEDVNFNPALLFDSELSHTLILIAPTLVFDPNLVLDFGPGYDFNSDAGPVLDSALHPDSATSCSSDLNEAGG